MKQLFIITAAMALSLSLLAQPKKYVSLSFFNTETDFPFAKFTGMFKDALHPGIEFSYGKNISLRKNHEWFREYKLAWFYQRYVQTGIPVYIDFGYRHHFKTHLCAETSLGAGVMKSIPGTGVFEQNSDGEWAKDRSKGRWQLIVTYGIGLGYTFNPEAAKPLKIFTCYQQRIQFPFVKSYVPLLPYNNFYVGVAKTIGNKKSKSN